MQFLVDLWLPILLSAVGVFLISSVLHMLVPIHKGDYGRLPDEARLMAAMREQRVAPGAYAFPCATSMKDMGSPEMKAKYQLGPVGTMLVKPTGSPAMGQALLLWFLFSVLVGVLVAYLASSTLAKGAECAAVFRVTGTAAFLAYAIYPINDTIWKGQRWGVTGKFLFDGLLYSLVTGWLFGCFWPA